MIVEQHEAEACAAGQCLLFGKEVVEACDGGLDHRCHGARAVEDEYDFGVVGVHM